MASFPLSLAQQDAMGRYRRKNRAVLLLLLLLMASLFSITMIRMGLQAEKKTMLVAPQ
jgi:hypothetical protein